MSKSLSLSDLLDLAVDKLPFLRRSTIKLRFAISRRYREAVLGELAESLMNDPRSAEILGADYCEQLASGVVTVSTVFIEADKIDNIERILKLIVEYLPQIIAIVMKLFAASLLFLALALATSTVSAQHWSYPGSIEWHLRNDHGVATQGMTREQMLSMHDALHEGRAVSSYSGRAFQPVRKAFRLFRR